MSFKAGCYWAAWGSASFSWPRIPEPRDIGIQTLPLLLWLPGVGGRSRLVEDLGVGGQSLSCPFSPGQHSPTP